MLQRIVGEDVDLAMLTAPNLARIRADKGSIEQVIINLVVNARDAMPTGGKLTLETANVVLDGEYVRAHFGTVEGKYVMLAVSDNGQGIDKETQARVFEPFFTTKEKGKGTGLGLSTVHGIVQQSGGYIWLYSEPGLGTTFKIYLPETDTPPEISVPVTPPVELDGTETVLLVEDEDQVRAVARGILVRHGYRVLDAPNARDAISIAELEPEEIHLLLTDVVMPGLSGPELAKRLVVARPAMKVLCMSGYTDDSAVRHGVIESEIEYLQKPLTVESLTKRVREVLDRPKR
jgi:CheY-like chemotaxis protein